MVDNFELIKPLLKFEEPGNFYFLQVIQRKKDHKAENKRLGRNNNARLIKAFYIYSVEELDEHKPEIIELCKTFNARAGINLNQRNDRRVSLAMNTRLAACLESGNYRTEDLYNTCCGELRGEDRLWIVDIDNVSSILNMEHSIPLIDEKHIEKVAETIAKLRPLGVQKIVGRIPTKNGIHLITNPFDSEQFKIGHPDVEIHKNNPTVLYVP